MGSIRLRSGREAVVALGIALALLAGCGQGERGETSSGTEQVERGQVETAEVTYYYLPL